MAGLICIQCGRTFFARLTDTDADSGEIKTNCFDCWQQLVDLSSYIGEFENIAEISIRGDGAFRFLYAFNHSRAVEMSEDSLGGMFVEYWDDSSESPVGSENFLIRTELINRVSKWLKKTEDD